MVRLKQRPNEIYVHALNELYSALWQALALTAHLNACAVNGKRLLDPILEAQRFASLHSCMHAGRQASPAVSVCVNQVLPHHTFSHSVHVFWAASK